ncbi:histidinol-phosphatase HisJ family protein [Prolixibacteraceae bacterium JC049]|nr:histidinol-phosphatase HisJ family protein [Prolixibacteraceae bacterium JC049]
MIDLHMHTQFSDGKDWHTDHIARAKELGIRKMGIADHICLEPVKWAVDSDQIANMTNRMVELKKENSDEFNLLFGIEVDYFPGREQEIQSIIELIPVDYAIGSIHFLGDWNYDTDKNGYEDKDIDALYHHYFETVQKAAQSGLFDILGHLDLIKKFQIWPNSNMTELYRKTAQVIAENDVVVELNTSGIDRPCGEFFPNREILELLCEHGVKVTMGSDAHRTEQVGRHFQRGIELLQEIGFKELCYFEKRKRYSIAFNELNLPWTKKEMNETNCI